MSAPNKPKVDASIGQDNAKPTHNAPLNKSRVDSTQKNPYLVRPNVGPGQYSPKLQQTKDRAPSYSMHGRVNPEFNKSRIGPGQYQHSSQFEKNKSGYHFSKDKRDESDRRNIPGPGSYNFEKGSKLGKKQQPKYQFGNKIKQNYDNHVPGPGQYQGKENYSRIGGIISKNLANDSKMVQDNIIAKQIPGPGSYNEQKYYNDEWLKGKGKYSLGKGSRDMQASKNPGPGAYDHLQRLSFKGKITFGKDQKLKLQKQNTPGPGQYKQKSIFKSASKKNILGK